MLGDGFTKIFAKFQFLVAESIDDLVDQDMAIIKKAEKELSVKTVNIYLDIDGVLLHRQKNRAPIGVDYFLRTLNKLIMSGNDVYWLNTHCNGDASTAVKYIEPYLTRHRSTAIIELIKPTTWTVKTQGIDFSKPFLWFDDKPLGWADKEAMKTHGATDSLVIIDLNKHPFALISIAFKLKQMVKKVAARSNE